MAKKKLQPGAAGATDRTAEDTLREANVQTSNHPDPEGTESVRVLPGHVYYVDGQAYLQGMVFDLPAKDAKAAADAGQVEVVSAPERRKY